MHAFGPFLPLGRRYVRSAGCTRSVCTRTCATPSVCIRSPLRSMPSVPSSLWDAMFTCAGCPAKEGEHRPCATIFVCNGGHRLAMLPPHEEWVHRGMHLCAHPLCEEGCCTQHLHAFPTRACIHRRGVPNAGLIAGNDVPHHGIAQHGHANACVPRLPGVGTRGHGRHAFMRMHACIRGRTRAQKLGAPNCVHTQLAQMPSHMLVLDVAPIDNELDFEC